MSDRMEFYVSGKPLDGGTYHYVECGLNNVYLLNGFVVEEDPDYGMLVSFDDTNELHKAIAIRIIENGNLLTPGEFKFFRKLMRMTQKTVADIFGVDTQTIANYEKGKSDIPKTADAVFKATFLLSVFPKDVRASIIKEIMNLHDKKSGRLSRDCRKEKSKALIYWRGAECLHSDLSLLQTV